MPEKLVELTTDSFYEVMQDFTDYVSEQYGKIAAMSPEQQFNALNEMNDASEKLSDFLRVEIGDADAKLPLVAKTIASLCVALVSHLRSIGAIQTASKYPVEKPTVQ